MRSRTYVIQSSLYVFATGLLAVGFGTLVSCSSGTSSNPANPALPAALQGPLVFVNNTGDKTLTTVALRGDANNEAIGTLGPAVFGNVALGDMSFSEGEWVFMNLGAGNAVAAIDPLTGAVPVHETNLNVGTRPVHIYRDPTDGEVMWVMNDGDNAGGTPTPGDDLINCAVQTGGSVTILHNSHLGPGANPPTVVGTVCLLADGHKVTAFSSGAGIPKRAFVSSTTAGEIAVINNDPANAATYQKMIARIDLCDTGKEALRPVPAVCNDESATPLATPFTVNNANPHGIRFSKLTGKVYSIQENYRTIVEIDPATLAITNTFDLAATPYTGYGMSPDGRFLLLRGSTAAPVATKFGAIDLVNPGNPITDFATPEQDGTLPSSGGSFKFSPDGKRLYVLAGNAATATKKDRLFAYDSSALPTLTLLRETILVATGGHSMDVLVQGAAGAGEAKYIVVSNSTDNSLSIINATDNLIKQTVPVGLTPGGVTVYYPGAAAAGNQAVSSLTGGSIVTPSVLPERLDDHGMPE